MNDDIFESVSQRGNGAYDEEERRVQEVSNCPKRLEEFKFPRKNGMNRVLPLKILNSFKQ